MSYYVSAITEMLMECSEEKQKGLYDFMKLMQNTKKTEQTEPAPEPEKPQKYFDTYGQNKTMQLLGKQYIGAIVRDNDLDGMKEIAEARNYDFYGVMSLLVDVFIYGHIQGKREERARKKATTQTTK